MVMALTLRVREFREAAGLTQADLAERAGVRRATVNRIEKQRIKAIDMGVLEKLADALGIEHPGALITRVRDGATEPPPTRSYRRRRR